jgi:membrane protein implicated in regulation of membrane protease activity
LHYPVAQEGTNVAAYWIWWALAGVLVGAELLTGTFYLLAVGVAFGVGGLAAWLGAGHVVQLVVAAAIAVAGVFAAHRWRTTRGRTPAETPHDVGQLVAVKAWQPDGTARVAYRGTLWSAVTAAPDTPRAESMYIVAIRGSTLVIADRMP